LRYLDEKTEFLKGFKINMMIRADRIRE